MHYRLALDLGTASIGLVAITLDENSEPVAVPYHSVRIFPEPLNKGPNDGVGEPKKAVRRKARQQRRQIERKARRLKGVAHCLPLLGLDPKALPPDTGQCIHRLRAQAATDCIELADFARVLLKMAKRRGFAGGFRSDKMDENRAGAKSNRGGKPKHDEDEEMENTEDMENEKEMGIVKAGIQNLKAEMEALGLLTLGQFIAIRYQRNEEITKERNRIIENCKAESKNIQEALKELDNIKPIKLKALGYYAHRDMLKDEFERIWEVQAGFHPIMRGIHEGRLIKDIFYQALFYQRPLKSPAPMVGNCLLEKSLPRAPASQQVVQTFRIEKQLADLRWGMGRNQHTLSSEQRSVIRGLLQDQEKLSFKSIYEALEKAGCPKPPARGLNMDRISRNELKGDKTRSAWRKLGLLGDWDGLEGNTKTQLINFLADLGSVEQLLDPQWPTQFHKKVRAGKDEKGRWTFKTEPRQFSYEFTGFINKLVENPKFGRLSAMGFDSGRSSYSVKALDKLTKIMQEEAKDEHEAIKQAYPEHFADKAILSQLPPAPVTGNTVIDVAMRQVGKEIRNAISYMGGLPEEIIVELSRDMALGIKARDKIEKINAANRKQHDKAVKALQEAGLTANKRNILKYLLWIEQETQCPYCPLTISLAQVADGNASNIEHILPHSLTRVGKKRDQLVLAHIHCNNEKRDKTPWQAWGGNPPRNPDRWNAVLAQAKRYKKPQEGKARLLKLQEWEAVLDEEAIKGFSDRQFQETSWIAKHTAQWLKSICKPGKLQVSRGEMTAYLRKLWHLETVIPQARFESDPPLPVLDIEGQAISRQDFDRHRAFWEGRHELACAQRTDRRIDKRIDHRHHLIDALVIGLSSPKLYQRMAREYKARAERRQEGERVKLTLAIAPPLPGLRRLALELVKNCNLCHRQDHYPDGAMFKATAYGLAEITENGQGKEPTVKLKLKPEAILNGNDNKNAKRLLTLRKNLGNLALDNNQKPLAMEKVRKALDSIASPRVRELVITAFEQRTQDNKLSPLQALSEPILYPEYGTVIKTVTLMHGNADEAYPVIHRSRRGTHYKLLPHDGYAYLELSPDGKTTLVHPVKAMELKHSKPSTTVLRFYKGDTVFLPDEGKHYLIRQIKSQNGGLLVMVPITETREVRHMKQADGLITKSGKALLKLKPK